MKLLLSLLVVVLGAVVWHNLYVSSHTRGTASVRQAGNGVQAAGVTAYYAVHAIDTQAMNAQRRLP